MKLKEITIELTQQCPNCCVYCSSLSSPTKRTILSVEMIEEAIADAVSLGARTINLSGGEPFMHPDILRIVKFIHQQQVSCLIYSSGIVLEKDKPVSIPNKLLEGIKGKVEKLIVNVEAADEITYNQIMGTSFGGFQLMQSSVRMAISLGITVEAHVVPTKLNTQQLPKIIGMCGELGISRISFLRLVVQGRALHNKKQLLLSDGETTIAKHLIATEAKSSKSNIRLGIPFGDCSQRVNCMTGISKLDIRYDGMVYPCEAFKNDNIGSLITAQADSICDRSLKDIYYTSEYLIDVRRLLNAFQRLDTCETCMNQYYSEK